MQLRNQLLDYSKPWVKPDVYLFTGNPIIKRNGAVVMGRGAAKQVRDTYPGIDMAIGAELIKYPSSMVIFVPIQDQQWIGWFKVKDHWQQQAKPDLIARTVNHLNAYATGWTDHTFHMNYPGIGNGRLTVDEVNPHLQALSDNVILYRKEP